MKNTDIAIKQSEIIQSLASLDSELISLLTNYTNVEEYEIKLKEIMKQGDDLI